MARSVLTSLTYIFALAASPTVADQIICPAPNSHEPFVMAAGDSFAVFAWRDNRRDPQDPFDIFAQRIDSYGNAQWSSLGIGKQVCGAAGAQFEPAMAVGPEGTTWIAWEDQRSCSTGDVYVQAVQKNGSFSCSVDGARVIGGNCGYLHRPAIAGLTGGEAVVVWHQNVGTGFGQSQNRIYAQKVSVAACALNWGSGGIEVYRSGTVNDRPGAMTPYVIADPGGGFICTWTYSLSDFIYVRKVDSAGTPLWGGAVRICTSGGAESAPSIASDGSGGAIVAWEQDISGTRSVRGQRIDASGVAQWGACGKIIASGGGDLSPQLVRSTLGRTFVFWQSNQAAGQSDIWMQRINLLGDTLSTRVPISSALYAQTTPRAVAGANGSCLVAWEDGRDIGSGDVGSVYAQIIDSNGATLCASDGFPIAADLERREFAPKVAFTSIGTSDQHGPTGQFYISWNESSANPGIGIYGKPVGALCSNVVAAPISDIEAAPALWAFPNPSTSSVQLTVRGVPGGLAQIEILDLAGRLVAQVEAIGTSSGHAIGVWDGRNRRGERARPGVYFARFGAGLRQIRTPIVIAR